MTGNSSNDDRSDIDKAPSNLVVSSIFGPVLTSLDPPLEAIAMLYRLQGKTWAGGYDASSCRQLGLHF